MSACSGKKLEYDHVEAGSDELYMLHDSNFVLESLGSRHFCLQSVLRRIAITDLAPTASHESWLVTIRHFLDSW